MKNNYLIIPYSLLQDETLSLSAKLVLAMIISLTRIKGECYASNSYISKKTGITERTVSRSVQVLADNRYVFCHNNRHSYRTIHLNKSVLKDKGFFFYDTPDKMSEGSDKMSNPIANFSNPIDKMSTNNNIYNNNKNNNDYYYNKNNSLCIEGKPSYDIDELMIIR